VVGLLQAEEQAGLLAGVVSEAVGDEVHQGAVEFPGVAQVALDDAAGGVELDAGQVGGGHVAAPRA
jgi:hypothetical protein